MSRPLHIVFAAPAYWPATAFGGPIPVMRALARELSQLGHRVDVVTTTLTSVNERPARTTITAELDGATIRYLGTPLRYRCAIISGHRTSIWRIFRKRPMTFECFTI